MRRSIDLSRLRACASSFALRATEDKTACPEEIKRLVAKSENDAVEFKRARGGVPADF